MTRVLHITSEFPPLYFGGLGTSLAGLADAQVDAGLEVMLLLVAGERAYTNPYFSPYGNQETSCRLPHGDTRARLVNGASASPTPIPVVSCPAQDPASALVTAVRWRPDAIHLHSSWLWPIAHEVRAALGVPVTYTVHSLDTAEKAAGEEISHGNIQAEAIVGSDNVVVLAYAERELILRQHPEVARRLHVIGNGIGACHRPRARRARGPKVLFVGRFARRKGLADLLAAIPRVLRAVPSAEFICVGGHAELPASLVPYRKCVSFTGWLDASALCRRYRAADVLVVPSRYEPFGMVALEGMSHGVTVVAAATGGLAEIIDDGRTGVLFPPGDPAALAGALERVLSDDAFRLRVGRAGRSEATSRWSWDRRVTELLRVYTATA